MPGWIAFFLLLSLSLSAKQHKVPVATTYLDATGNYSHVQPGDTLLLHGSKEKLILKNFRGKAGLPIVFTNTANAPLIIASNNAFGISIQNCQYVKLAGRSISGHHGIQVKTPKGVGIGVGKLSENWVLHNIEVGPTKGPGILAKTTPSCGIDASRENFLQQGGSILFCYIHNTGTEGIYFGSTAYKGVSLTCNGEKKRVLPHLISHGEIAYNVVAYTGWDGIQVASASHTNIHHNTVLFDSQKRQRNQMNGIIAGLGYSGHIYNNLIMQGDGTGLLAMATDSLCISNNIILNPGYSAKPGVGKYGMYLNLTNKDIGWLQVSNNLIANPPFQAIHAKMAPQLRTSTFANNLITYNSRNTNNRDKLIDIQAENKPKELGNIIIPWKTALDRYWDASLPTQRKNSITTNTGVTVPQTPHTDFNDLPRVDSANTIDVGPFEYHSTVDTSATACSPLIHTVAKRQPLPQRVFIYNTQGTRVSNHQTNAFNPGDYILVDPQLGCRFVFKIP